MVHRFDRPAMARPSSIRLRWLAVLAVAAVILYWSVVPPPTGGRRLLGPLGLVGLDKWLHAIAFAGLAATLVLALGPSPRSHLVIVTTVIGVTVAYGVGIELVQLAVPTRQFSVADLAADAVGAVAVVLGWRLLYRRQHRVPEPGS